MKEQIKISSIKELLVRVGEFGGIHIECNQETADCIFQELRNLGKTGIGYVLHTDHGYDNISVWEYLKLFSGLLGKRKELKNITERFGLTDVIRNKLRQLRAGERMAVQLARVSMQDADLIYLEEPLLNLDSDRTGRVLRWMGERREAGVCFITANASMRHALLMPGTAFYEEEGSYVKMEQGQETDETDEEELRILKIAARSGTTTLLFEPKDIDYVESLNKCNYISVRGTHFQVTHSMDELEGLLGRSGFFRCHRSYIVNMQRVGQIEKLTRNSYSLLLNDKDKSRIPLAKGRVESMKETYGL